MNETVFTNGKKKKESILKRPLSHSHPSLQSFFQSLTHSFWKKLQQDSSTGYIYLSSLTTPLLLTHKWAKRHLSSLVHSPSSFIKPISHPFCHHMPLHTCRFVIRLYTKSYLLLPGRFDLRRRSANCPLCHSQLLVNLPSHLFYTCPSIQPSISPFLNSLHRIDPLFNQDILIGKQAPSSVVCYTIITKIFALLHRLLCSTSP